MRRRTILSGVIALTAATMLAGSATHSGTPVTVAKAENRNDRQFNRVLISENLLGLLPDQTLRVCVGQKISLDEKRRESRARLELYGEEGGVIRTYDLVLPRDQFRCQDVARGDLLVPGDPGTERIQLRVRIVIFAEPGDNPLDFVGSIERTEPFPTSRDLIDADFNFSECGHGRPGC